MSRTTHELAKAKEAVLLAATELQADPTNMVKYTALVSAINDLERDRNTVQGAMLKAFANPTNPQTSSALAAALPHLLFNPAVHKAIQEEQAHDRAEFEKRLTPEEPTETVQDAVAKALGINLKEK
jgi:hypothetical protein